MRTNLEGGEPLCLYWFNGKVVLYFCSRFYQPSWVIILSCVEKFTMILNSSINFVYYCLAGKAFRQQMCKVGLTLKLSLHGHIVKTTNFH